MKPITLKNQGLEFTLLRIIGQGRQSICYEAENQNKSIFYVKILKNQTDENKRAFKKAYEINQNLVSRHAGNSTSATFAYLEDETYGPFVVMPKYEGNTLGKAHFKTLHELFHTFLSLSKAINQVHSAEHLVLDLSLDNVYVLTDNGGMSGVYLHDFDSMLSLDAVRIADNIGTSISFTAPEVLLEEFPSVCQQTDYYSLGAMLHTILFGYSPMADQPDPLRYRNTLEPYCAVLKNSIQVQNALNAFWARCLAFYPTNRYQDYEELEDALVQLCDLTHPSVLRTVRSNFIPYLPEFYVRQHEELEQIKKHFGLRRDQFAMATIHSPVSGAGKSTLALAAAYELQQNYDAIEFCRWDPATGFQGILKQIQTNNSDDPKTALLRNTQNVLITIDNFDEKTSPPLPYWGKHHFLFTSRYCSDSFNPLIETGECIRVDVRCDEARGKEIFHNVYNSLSKGKHLHDEELSMCYSLLKDMEYHSYGCDLLARRAARRGISGIRNIKQLFNNIILSRKDRRPGEAASSNSFQNHLHILFNAELEDAMQDPIKKEILFLFSLDKQYNEGLLYCLVGDDLESGRFEAEDAVENLEQRGLVRLEKDRFYGGFRGNGVSVHPLVFELLTILFKEDDQWESEKHMFSALSNLWSIYLDELRTPQLHENTWPSGFWLTATAGIGKEWSRNIDLISAVMTFDNLYYRAVLKRSFSSDYEKSDLIMLCSMQLDNQVIYFLYFSNEHKIVPLARLEPRYFYEKTCQDISFEEFQNLSSPITIQTALFRGKSHALALPCNICGNPVDEIMRVEIDIGNIYAGSLYIPEGICSIGPSAMRGLPLREVILPNSLTKIWDNAFSYTHIDRIRIPENTQYLGQGAFECCHDLVDVEITSPNIKIGSYAFRSCGKLKRLIFPEGIKFDESVLWGCPNLTIYGPEKWLAPTDEILALLEEIQNNVERPGN